MRRMICVIVIYMIVVPMLHAQLLGSITPVPNCIAGNQDGYGSMGLEGGYLFPDEPQSWGKCFNSTGVADLNDLGKFVNSRIDANFVFQGQGYSGYIFNYLGAPTGCNAADFLLASEEWHQTFQDIATYSDAYIRGVINCEGITCGFQEVQDFLGGEGLPREPVVDGTPQC